MLEIEIRGIPKPQARPRVFVRGQKAISWSPKSEWRDTVLKVMRFSRPPQPLEGFISVELTFFMPRPKSCKKDQVFMNKRPDFDNLSKAVLDAAQEAGWIKDDGQIVDARVIKRYENGSGPGCNIKMDANAWG